MAIRLIPLFALLFWGGCGTARQAVWLSGQRGTVGDMLAGERLESRSGGCCTDADAQKLLANAAERVRAASSLDSAVEYRVLRTPAVNAYSLPGTIYVTRGLMQRLNRDELLAAAVAHEIAHVESGDSLRPLRGDADCELQREIAADQRAVELLARAGIRTGAMGELLDAIRDELSADAYAARSRALQASKPRQ